MRRLLALACLLVVAATLSGCGNKGPLYLPRSGPATAGSAVTPATAASAPASAASAATAGQG